MNYYVSTMKNVLFAPKTYFPSFKSEAGTQSIGKSVGFIAVMSLAGGVIAAILGLIFPVPIGSRWVALGAIAFYPIAGILGSFISAGIVWLIVRLLGVKPTYPVVFALMAVLAAFMPVSALFSRVIIVSVLVSLWSFVVFVLGTIVVLEVKPVKAWIAFGLLAVLLIGLSFWAMRTSQQLLLEAQRQNTETALPETPAPAADNTSNAAPAQPASSSATGK